MMKTKEEIHHYWRTREDGHNDALVRASHTDRSDFLLGMVQRYLPDRDSHILELGCDVGRNLNALYSAGYHNLTGIEINQDSVKMMPTVYPQLASVPILNTTIEDSLVNMAPRSFDLVFTMAVLQHLHPDSECVFKEIVRITQSYLITIEDERGDSPRHFPRNYRHVFEGLGMHQIDEPRCRVRSLPRTFKARIFQPVVVDQALGNNIKEVKRCES